jgi:hypothetical protein
MKARGTYDATLLASMAIASVLFLIFALAFWWVN